MSKKDIIFTHLVDQCTLLDACLNETLRLCTGASSARNVDAATTISTHILSPPAKILIPYHQLHYEEGFFGPEVRTFNPQLLLDKDLAKSSYFKPFGGGGAYYSARVLARREVLALAAVLLSQYEVELEGKVKGIPEMDRVELTMEVMNAVGGEDLLVRLHPRVV